MADPPQFNHPDRLYGDNWHPLADNPGPDNDWGGVHTNNGVGNKLCYLLTDGDTFNGYTISAMDVSTTADLMYECQTNLLTSSADYYDLGNVLQLAAINIECTQTERENVEKGCRAVQIAPNLMGWWKFDGTAADSTNYANNGTLIGDPQWVDGKIDGALGFDGDGDYVSLDPIGALAGDLVTISAWIKRDVTERTYLPIVSTYHNDGLDHGYLLYVKKNPFSEYKPRFYIATGTGVAVESDISINTDWHHLSGTYDGSSLKIYVNGEPKPENVSSKTGYYENYNTTYIGYEDNIPGAGSVYFDGLIDDVRVYNYALDMFEIWDVMSGDLPRFRIKNNSDETVAWFDYYGNLFLKGEHLEDAEDPIPSGSFIITDSEDVIVAYIGSQGNLWIDGNLTELCGACSPAGDAFIIKNPSNIIVGYIDFANGNLCLTGKLYKNPQ